MIENLYQLTLKVQKARNLHNSKAVGVIEPQNLPAPLSNSVFISKHVEKRFSKSITGDSQVFPQAENQDVMVTGVQGLDKFSLGDTKRAKRV